MFKTLTKLASVNGGLILVQFLWLPLLTRLYAPYEFGSLGVTLGISIILSVFFTLRLESAIPLQPERFQVNLTYLLAALSVIIFIGLFLLSYLFFELVYWRAFVLALLMTITNLFTQVHASGKRYSSFLRLKVVLVLSLILFQYLFRSIEDGLTYALIASFAVSICYDQISNFKFYSNRFGGNIKKGFEVLIKYRTHLFFGLPESILQRVSANGIQLLVPQLYGLQSAGLIFNVIRLASYPQTLVASSLGDIFIGNLSAKSGEELRIIVRNHLKLLINFYILIFCFSSFLTDSICIYFLGEEWGISTYFKLYISFSIFHSFYANYGRYLHYVDNLGMSLLVYIVIVITQCAILLVSAQISHSELSLKLLLFAYPAAFLIPSIIIFKKIFGTKMNYILLEFSPLLFLFSIALIIMLISHPILKYLSILLIVYLVGALRRDDSYKKV